jgi:hypothetical protein
MPAACSAGLDTRSSCRSRQLKAACSDSKSSSASVRAAQYAAIVAALFPPYGPEYGQNGLPASPHG